MCGKTVRNHRLTLPRHALNVQDVLEERMAKYARTSGHPRLVELLSRHTSDQKDKATLSDAEEKVHACCCSLPLLSGPREQLIASFGCNSIVNPASPSMRIYLDTTLRPPSPINTAGNHTNRPTRIRKKTNGPTYFLPPPLPEKAITTVSDVGDVGRFYFLPLGRPAAGAQHRQREFSWILLLDDETKERGKS